jgi:uncharacterized protein (TIGR02001 family)
MTLTMMLTGASTAAAQAEEAPLFGGNVQFMTNYVAIGLSQSVGQPGVEAELDYNLGDGWYGGLSGNSTNWVSQLYPGSNVSLELNGWAGYRMHFAGDWSWKAGVLRLQFPGDYAPQTPPVAEPNSTEAFGYLSWRRLSAKLSWMITDSFGKADSRGSWYLDLNASQPLGPHWILGEHLGRKHDAGTNPVTGLRNDRADFTDYKLAITYGFADGISLTLAHTWTNGNPAIFTLNGYDLAGHHTWMLLEKDF